MLDHARRFDAPDLTSIACPEQEIENADVEPKLLAAIEAAYKRIRDFHDAQFGVFTSGLQNHAEHGLFWQIDSQTRLGQRYLALSSAGLYVPGGLAAYPSSVLMLGGPAKSAGLDNLVLTTPAKRDGLLPSSVLAGIRTVGIKQVIKVGGASAIAALALGTESIPRVDKIVGPGNKFVNEAKRQLWGTVGLDGYAGPSEVCMMLDDSANLKYAAADLITQIEHAPDNAAYVVSVSRELVNALMVEVERQVAGGPREEILRACLLNESVAFVARDLAEACEVVNEIAPEHLTLSVKDPEKLLGEIQNAGCILMGELTPESVADYCLGPSHTLPTAGAVRFGSPINVLDFLKVQSVANLTRLQLDPLIELAQALGEAEGLPAHAYGATVRRER